MISQDNKPKKLRGGQHLRGNGEGRTPSEFCVFVCSNTNFRELYLVILVDMIRQDFKPNYVRAARMPPGVGPGDPGGGDDLVASNGLIGPNAVASLVSGMERDDRRENSEKKKAMFRNKVQHEQRRRYLSKGNIVTFTFNDPRSFIDKEGSMQRALTVGGFEKKNVLQMKLNDYRGNECEVLFEEDLEVDCEAVEEKLKKNALNVTVSKFLDAEEICMVYGLPLTSDVDSVIEQIKQTISPFVKKVVSITATKHFSKKENDFFHGCLNGNYKVKVVPLVNHQIPNYVPIGKDEQVQAKVHYVRHLSEKKVMCNNCYSTEHLANSDMCQGVSDWTNYVTRFEKMRDDVLAINEDARNLSVPSFIKGGEEIRKLRAENIDLQAENEQLLKEKTDISERFVTLERKMRELARSKGLEESLVSDDSFMALDGDSSVSDEPRDSESGENGAASSQPTPVPAPAPGPQAEGESGKRKASDLSKVKGLVKDDVIWFKKPHSEEVIGRFLKLLNHDTGKISIEVPDNKGLKKIISVELNRCLWGTITGE